MNIRPINIETELPAVRGWWESRGTPMPAAAFLSAEGFVAEHDGALVAASWLYVVPGTQGGIGVVEFTGSNPAFAASPELVDGLKALYARLEERAWALGCGSLLSFVAPNSWEQRTFARAGWQDLTGGKPHLTYGKVAPCP